METILQVNNVNRRFKNDEWKGVKIVTNKQTIEVLVDVYQSCCEIYDVIIITPDNQDVIGYEVKSVKWGKCILVDYLPVIKSHEIEFNEKDTQQAIVNIETDKGLIQIVTYNIHNGYYPHKVSVKWNDYSDIQEI